MRTDMEFNVARLLEQLTGVFLIVVGLCFLVLFAFLKGTGQLSGDLKVSAFMLTMSAILVWIGYRFLRTKVDEAIPEEPNRLIRDAHTLPATAEVLAAMGCFLMLLHAVCVMRGIVWPPKPLLYVLVGAPVVIGHYVLRVLKPGAFQVGVFPVEVIEKWSAAGVRRAISFLLRVGWLGYISIPFAWPDVNDRLPVSWAPPIGAVACCLISVLYATQALMLHSGARRMPWEISNV